MKMREVSTVIHLNGKQLMSFCIGKCCDSVWYIALEHSCGGVLSLRKGWGSAEVAQLSPCNLSHPSRFLQLVSF